MPDVGLDPLQRGDLIEQAVVARRAVGLLGQIGGGQKAEDAQTVVAIRN